MTLLGQFALWAAFLVGLLCVVRSCSGRWQGRPDLSSTIIRSVYGICGCLLVASVSLWKGLISHDFNMEYVWAYTSSNLPSAYIFSAFWAGQKGSLLFWAVVLSLFASAAQLLTPRRFSDLMPYVAGVTSAVITFFVSVMLFAANPFERLGFTPAHRRGLNPALQERGGVTPPPTAGASTRSFRTWGWSSTPRCSISATSASPFRSPLQSRRCSPADST